LKSLGNYVKGRGWRGENDDLNDKIADNSTIVRMHARTKGVEDTSNTDFNTCLLLICVPRNGEEMGGEERGHELRRIIKG
jgi:hypothetical protein